MVCLFVLLFYENSVCRLLVTDSLGFLYSEEHLISSLAPKVDCLYLYISKLTDFYLQLLENAVLLLLASWFLMRNPWSVTNFDSHLKGASPPLQLSRGFFAVNFRIFL